MSPGSRRDATGLTCRAVRRTTAPRRARAPACSVPPAFRFAVVYAVLLAISAAALAFFLWWATAGLLDRQTEAAIRADAQGLSERWAEGGLPALVLTIQDRLAENVDDDAIYLLADSARPAARRQPGTLARRGAAHRRLVRAAGDAAPASHSLASGAALRPAGRLPPAGRARRARRAPSCARC